MSDDLDLGGIDQRHEPDPQFRAALRRRIVAMADGIEHADTTSPRLRRSIELEPAIRQAEQRRRNRWVTRSVLTVAGAAVVLTIVVILRSGGDGASPADSPSVSSTVSNGWVAFAAASGSNPDNDMYVVREGTPPRRIAGTATDGTDQVCPAFSPDGRRLMFGQAAGDQLDGYVGDPALVISDMSADGVPFATTTIPLEGATLPPCAIWSPDGRWAAFGVSTAAREPDPNNVDEVWVVDTGSDDIRRLPGLSVTDLDWTPSGDELAIAGGDVVLVYSIASDEIRPLGGAGAALLDWSPDGQTIAFLRDRALVLMDADGSDERILVPGLDANHGLGPVWSPDGDRIAYQRLCQTNNLGGACREEHEVVLVSVDDDDTGQPAGTQAVLPPPQTTGPDGPVWWYPWSVTWSPDGTALLYLAWPEAVSVPTTPHSELVAVPLDDETAPVVLTGDLSAAVYSGFPWLPTQSWGRRPAG